MGADGDWKVTMDTPMGSQQATLTLKSEGASLSGKVAGAQGIQEFSGGTVSPLAWKINIAQPMPMQLDFTASVDGDSISGNVKLGSFGNATFKGTRA
jgi:hypothetical protein